MEKYQETFISNLKFLRNQKGISQSQLAEICNVSNGTIGNIECGKTKPSFDLIFQIADALQIPAKCLFIMEEDEDRILYENKKISSNELNIIERIITSKFKITIKEIISEIKKELS